jgi:cellulose synthase/poly-beta-1,6-N-acetylglucosamine synthase-like glycosyltransferase
MVIEILFWIAASLILHTYVAYPLLLFVLDKFIKAKPAFPDIEFKPSVSVLMAVHNEERVLKEKLKALFESDYPVEVIVGSDASTDNTNTILAEMKGIHPSLTVIEYPERLGKPGIINRLSEISKGQILIITDANVIPEKNSIRQLVSNFSDKSIGLTDSRLVNRGMKKDGISVPEVVYINIESKLKNIEGRLWGTMMGPFGGFYALRKSCYEPNPGNILADDFRICMNVIGKGEKAISDPKAIVYEDVSNNLMDEFRRKARISAGNFQNLKQFAGLLLKPFSIWSFCFVSHKVIRWITPLLWMFLMLFNILLVSSSFFYLLLFILQVIFIILPAFDIILKKFNIHLVPLRFFTHLCFMNLALLVGFIRFIGGINSGIWTPTKRYK